MFRGCKNAASPQTMDISGETHNLSMNELDIFYSSDSSPKIFAKIQSCLKLFLVKFNFEELSLIVKICKDDIINEYVYINIIYIYML